MTFNEKLIPQMMPIKWMLIFFMCLMSLMYTLINFNYMLINFNMNKIILMKKKWKLIF